MIATESTLGLEKNKNELLRQQKLDEFSELASPLIKFLNQGWNPHTTIVITHDKAEILCADMGFRTDEYIED